MPKEIKKVAAAVSVVDMSKHEGHITVKAAALLTSGIPGKQTVPRAETTAGINVKRQRTLLATDGPQGILADDMYFIAGSSRKIS